MPEKYKTFKTNTIRLGMLGKLLKKFIKNKEGTTAVEFSLLAIPYVFLSLGIIEMSIMYASASLLEGATSSASRMIRTGSLQQSQAGNPEDLFRERVCDIATGLIECDNVVVEVVRLNGFSDFDNYAVQFDGDGNPTSRGFDAGGSSDQILVRTIYTYEMMTPFIGPLLAGADNSRTFISTIVLQTEPYDFQGAGA